MDFVIFGFVAASVLVILSFRKSLRKARAENQAKKHLQENRDQHSQQDTDELITVILPTINNDGK